MKPNLLQRHADAACLFYCHPYFPGGITNRRGFGCGRRVVSEEIRQGIVGPHQWRRHNRLCLAQHGGHKKPATGRSGWSKARYEPKERRDWLLEST